MSKRIDCLDRALLEAQDIEDVTEIARFYRDSVFVKMNELRAVVDELETIVPRSYWEYPSYGEILYSVH